MKENLMELICEVSPKYEKMADELVPFLLDYLRASNAAERIIAEKSYRLEESKRKPGVKILPVNPEETKALFTELKALIYDIAKDKCTEELLERGYGIGFGFGGRYCYVDEEFKLKFIMKSGKKAIIETYFHTESLYETKHQFTLKLTDEGWRISDRKYSHDIEDVWYKDKI